MTYTFKQNLVSKDKYSIKCPNTMTAEFIVVHNTANDAPAANEISYMISNNNEVSFHYAVDDKESFKAFQLTEMHGLVVMDQKVKGIVRGFKSKSVTRNQAVPVLKMQRKTPQNSSHNYSKSEDGASIKSKSIKILQINTALTVPLIKVGRHS